MGARSGGWEVSLTRVLSQALGVCANGAQLTRASAKIQNRTEAPGVMQAF